MTLNTVSIQKFVFIYDSLSDEWEFALSTNKVIFAFTLVETVLYNGIPYNNHDTWNNQVIAGNYYSATSDADRAFNNNTYAWTSIYECAARSESEYMDYMVIDIFIPEFPSQM